MTLVRGAGVVRAAVTARACLGIYVACVLMLGERVGRRGWAGAVLVGAGIAASRSPGARPCGGRASRAAPWKATDAKALRHDRSMSDAGLGRTIPALPVREMSAALDYYVERFGFEVRFRTGGFAVIERDDAVLHLWAASDESWRSRRDLSQRPIASGAETFLAGTASCRVEVEEVDALFAELSAADVVHSVSRAGVTETEFGTREFSTVDLDNNALTFFQSARRDG